VRGGLGAVAAGRRGGECWRWRWGRAWSTRSKGGSEWVGRSGPRSGKGGGWAEYPPGISVRVSDDPISCCWHANLLQTRLASLIYLVYFKKKLLQTPGRLVCSLILILLHRLHSLGFYWQVS
jgi:hypothetical protein